MLPILLSCCQVANVLSYHLMAPLVRLSVTCTVAFIFTVKVASADITMVIFINGCVERDKFKLSPHLSLASVFSEVDKLSEL
jgi:hypothetical protein